MLYFSKEIALLFCKFRAKLRVIHHRLLKNSKAYKKSPLQPIGLYSIQQPQSKPASNGKGRLFCDKLKLEY